ncbi:resolvase, N-terminal domain protein [Enterococcus faecalis TX4248]|uniref:Resolvase, N-terminal domain protein n=2 Tax=Enterococcus faecalis TaxID=1351 RepID=A0A125W5Y8_ENTFL|nr:resolvase, N-terminal domain protein [Enterococcus faecalis TX4248]
MFWSVKYTCKINVFEMRGKMARIGYIRVSSKDQNEARQRERYEKENIDKIFMDKISGKDTNRPEFKKMLEYAREGDTIVLTELARLGRNNKELTESLNYLNNKDVSVDILNLPSFNDVQDENLRRLLTNLILEIYKYQAENERKEILERQRQGVEIAKKKGVYKGRQSEYTADSKNPQKRLTYFKVVEMLKKGKPITKISKETGVSRPTIYSIKNRYQENSEELL